MTTIRDTTTQRENLAEPASSSRRAFLGKAAVAAGTAAWVGPAVSTLTASPAGAQGAGSPGPCVTIDFDGLAPGTIVSDQFPGVRFTTNDPTNHPLVVFDSSNPTGGDTDLGTPNQNFGGPGQGVGGEAGPYANIQALGHILIINEFSNPTPPDDWQGGGWIQLTFDTPVQVDNIESLDIEEDTSKIEAFAADRTLLGTVPIPNTGNNGYARVPVGIGGVKALRITLSGSGSVPSITYCP